VKARGRPRREPRSARCTKNASGSCSRDGDQQHPGLVRPAVAAHADSPVVRRGSVSRVAQALTGHDARERDVVPGEVDEEGRRDSHADLRAGGRGGQGGWGRGQGRGGMRWGVE